MNDEQLRGRALELRQIAHQLEHPLIPKAAKTAIAAAADVVWELAKREVERNAKSQ